MRTGGLAALLFGAGVARAQQPAGVVLSIVEGGGGAGLRAIVKTDSVSRFTNERGVIVLSRSLTWPHRFIVKRIGFQPLDTTLSAPADSVRLVMRRLPMTLARVSVKSGECKATAIAGNDALRVL